MDIVAHPSEKPPISLALMGISLVEARALGLDHDLPRSDITASLNAMDFRELRRYAQTCGLLDRGTREQVEARVIRMYGFDEEAQQ
jgi:hypothetical protein